MITKGCSCGYMTAEANIHEVGGNDPESLLEILTEMPLPWAAGDKVGIKVHWGEKGNHGFLSPGYTKTIVRWLQDRGMHPFVFDTTVLYSGGRRDGRQSLETAAEHGFNESDLGCPIVIGDGLDGRMVIDIPGFRHFKNVQVADIINKAQGFVIFSHFKGHMVAGFGGAIKNISMGFASRAQKQRMHADAYPQLMEAKCNRCGLCAEVCPAGAVNIGTADMFPQFDLKTCLGCAQCIANCPHVALKVHWEIDMTVFQERLVETAAALWRLIGKRTVCINALLNITAECDCLPGRHELIAKDHGFIAGIHPVAVDEASIKRVGSAPFDRAHSGLPWKRQFSYAREIGFAPR